MITSGARGARLAAAALMEANAAVLWSGRLARRWSSKGVDVGAGAAGTCSMGAGSWSDRMNDR